MDSGKGNDNGWCDVTGFCCHEVTPLGRVPVSRLFVPDSGGEILKSTIDGHNLDSGESEHAHDSAAREHGNSAPSHCLTHQAHNRQFTYIRVSVPNASALESSHPAI